MAERLRYSDGEVVDEGDRVTMIHRGCRDNCTDGHGPVRGEYGTVTAIVEDSECGNVRVEFDDYGATWVCDADQLVYGETELEDDETAESDRPYEVGDRVRLLVRGDYSGDRDTGGPKRNEQGVITKLGTPTQVAKAMARYPGEQLLEARFDSYGHWWVNSGRIELIEPATPQSEETQMAAAKVAEKATDPAGAAPTIERTGRQIILPEGMSLADGIKWLERRQAEEQTVVRAHHEFTGVYPLDALVAFHRALADLYNWTDNVPTPGFFGPQPPVMLTVKTGPNPEDFVSVPFGMVAIPGIAGKLAVGLTRDEHHNLFLSGEVKQGSMPQVRAIIEATERQLRGSSIYRGKAIKVNWQWRRDGRDFDMMKDGPTFMDLSGADERGLVFSADVQTAIDQGLFTPIEHSQACRENGVPLKRGILLEGPYGTGKTLTALVTALKASRNGWTFVYLDTVQDLRAGLKLATQYAPAVVFAEDIDRVVGGSRDEAIDEILNCLDGVDTKRQEIITILTTNHVEDMYRGMLRPGRLDTVVSVRPPDNAAVARLIGLYGRGLISPTANIAGVADKLASYAMIPAMIREVVERAKIAAIRRVGGTGDIRGKVTGADLDDAAVAMVAHAELLNSKREQPVERTLRVPLTIIDSQLRAN